MDINKQLKLFEPIGDEESDKIKLKYMLYSASPLSTPYSKTLIISLAILNQYLLNFQKVFLTKYTNRIGRYVPLYILLFLKY